MKSQVIVRRHARPEVGPEMCEECGGALEFLPTPILTTAFPHYRCVNCKLVFTAWGPKILGRCEDPADHQRDISLADQQEIIDRLDAEVRAEEAEAAKVGKEINWVSHAQRNREYCKRWYRRNRKARLKQRKAEYRAQKRALKAIQKQAEKQAQNPSKSATP